MDNFSSSKADYCLTHFGVGHDGNPPGRGSGRYAWGSGINNVVSLIDKTTPSIKNAISGTERVSKGIIDFKQKQDLSKISDEELQKIVKRYTLEKKYDELSKRNASIGMNKVKAILDIVGGVTAVTASTAYIVQIINNRL